MSQTPEVPPPPAPDPSPASPKRKRRWGRRLIRIGLALLLLALAFRLALPALLPWTINRVAGAYGLTCRYERMDLNLLGGDVGLWHVVIAPRNGGEPLLRAEYCRGAVAVFPLLRGKLHVRHAVADGADLDLERNADGHIPLLDGLIAGPKPASTKPLTLDLTPPLKIDALRLEHASAHLSDRAVRPEVDARFVADIGVSDLGSSVRPARFWVETSSQPLLDVLRIDGEGTSAGKTSDATVRVFARGIHAKPAAGYLAAFGIRPSAESLSLGFTAHLTTSPTTNDPSGIAAKLTISDAMVLADGQDAAAVDRVTIDTETVTPAVLRLGTVTVQGVRVRASRNPQGLAGAAGFEWAGTPPFAASGTSDTTIRAPIPTPGMMTAWSLTRLDVKDVRVLFTDKSISPESRLSLQVPQLSVKHVSCAPGETGTPTEIAATLLMPGVARSVEISANALPFAQRKSATGTVRAEGIRPDALEPYLRALGIRSVLNDASMSCALAGGLTIHDDGTIGADADFRDIQLSDSRQLLVMKGIKIGGASVASDLRSLRVDRVEIDGPALSAARGPDGSLSALGFRIMPSAPKQRTEESAPQAPAAPQTPSVAMVLPKVDIGHVVWKGVKLDLADQAVAPPASFSLTDAGVELDDLHIDPSGPATRPSQPGRFRAWLTAPGVAGKLLAQGTLTPTDSGASADIELNGSGIDARAAAPYLTALHIEPTLRDGSVHLRAKLDLSQQKDHLACSMSLSDVKLVEQGNEALAVDLAQIDGIQLRKNKVAVNAINVTRPRATLVRDEAGGLHVAGMRLLPRPATDEDFAGFASTPQSHSASQPASLEPPIAVALNKLELDGASLQWIDRSISPPSQITGSVSAELSDFVFGNESKPAPFKVTASAEGILDALTATGTVAISQKSAAANMAVSASGVREGALAGYLPPGSHIVVKDGMLALSLAASLALDEAGAASGRLSIDHFNWSDGDAKLLAFDSALAAVRRVDLPGHAVALDEISLAGFETTIERRADGQTRLFGVSIGPTTAQPPATQPSAPQLPMTPDSLSRPATDATALASARRKPLPLVTLQKLAVNLRGVRVTDESRPGAAPLTLADVDLVNRKPIELLGDDPAARPPVALQLTGGISPVVGSFKVDLDASPFAPRPTAQMEVAALGIRGDGVTELLPELKSEIDGRELKDGRFRAHLEAQANIVRKGPARFDFTHPFDLDVLVRGIDFREGPDGPALAGLDEVRSEAIHVEPDKKLVTVRTLEVSKPAAVAFRDAAGVHALGFIVKTASPTTRPAVVQKTGGLAQPVPPSAPQAAPPAPQDAPEIRIAKFTVSGIDFRYEDRSVSPVAVVPLTGVDVDVRNLSSRIMEANRPVKFSVLVNAGKVPVPAHSSAGAFTGAMKDLRTIQAGGHVAASQSIENRDLFSEIALDGQLVMYPQPKGYVRSSVSGLELSGFRGIAREEGVDVQDGTFDLSSNVRLPGDGSMDTRSKLSLTDLSVTEPPNGPIFRYLHLPAPLDVAIAAVRDQDGALAFPLDVPIKRGHLSGGDVSAAAVGAVGTIIVRALAAAPVKAAGAVTDTVTDVVGAIVPLGDMGKKKPKQEPPVIIVFPAGATVPGSRESAELATLVQRLRKDPTLDVTLRHELGYGDVRRSAVLANPSPQQCLALAAQLREKRDGLLQLQAQAAGRAQAALAVAPAAQVQATVHRLRGIDRELALTDDALDQLYEMLRPGAERQADRRTRKACLDIARARLGTIQAALASQGIEADKRARVVRPQFAVTDADGGRIVITVIRKKS